jgi:hypothetical protein
VKLKSSYYTVFVYVDFTKERNKKERYRKEIDYLYGLDKEKNKEREKYNG